MAEREAAMDWRRTEPLAWALETLAAEAEADGVGPLGWAVWLEPGAWREAFFALPETAIVHAEAIEARAAHPDIVRHDVRAPDVYMRAAALLRAWAN